MKKKNLLLITIVILLFFTSGCDLFQKNKEHLLIPDFKIKEDLNRSITGIETNTAIIVKKTEIISTKAQSIYNSATIIESEIPDENKEKINPHLESIKENSKSIIKNSQEILKVNMSIQEIKNILISAKDKVKSTDLILEKLVKERDEALEAKKIAEEQKNSQLHKTLQWLIAACIVGCGAFIILFFFTGSRGGLFAAGGCGLVLIIAIFVDKYIAYLAIAGGAILLLMVGVLVYNIYVKNKALLEIVDTVEITKSELSDESKLKIFGEKKKIGETKKIQSPSTEAEIKKIKLKNKLKNLLKK